MAAPLLAEQTTALRFDVEAPKGLQRWGLVCHFRPGPGAVVPLCTHDQTPSVLAVIDWDTVSISAPYEGTLNDRPKILPRASRAGQPSFIHRMQRLGAHCSIASVVTLGRPGAR